MKEQAYDEEEEKRTINERRKSIPLIGIIFFMALSQKVYPNRGLLSMTMIQQCSGWGMIC
jgi:hypothetical protein